MTAIERGTPAAPLATKQVFLVCAAISVLAATCGGSPNAPDAGEPRLFFDDFGSGAPAQWTPYAGDWDVDGGQRYKAPRRIMNQAVAGSLRWTDYQVEATVTLHEDAGKIGLLGRVAGTHRYYELLLGREGGAGARSWFIRRRVDHVWTTLASGPFEYRPGVAYRLRFSLRGDELEGAISGDAGRTFVNLGGAQDHTFKSGRIGLGSYYTSGSFDDVSVVGVMQQAQVGPWGPIAELRDDTTTFPTGKPPGGWYVTPIHATLRASDGKVVVTGFGRKAEANCTSSTQRQVGETFVISPSHIDAVTDGDTLLVQPLDEQNRDPVHEVLYCAGHNTLADGRIFYAGGTRYPNTLPNSNPELGLDYSRIFDPATDTLTRINAPMKGGQASTPGMKWYPTQLLMPDSRVLIFGGFHFWAGLPGDKVNVSFELFDPAIWDADRAADPYTVLTQHSEGQLDTAPTRGYTNLFLLPKPVPASHGGGFARSVAVAGGVGKVLLFNHEPGPTGAQRLFARTNALTPNPSAAEKAEGASGLMLPDGKLMITNGGHDGPGAARAQFYDPYADSWSTLELGVSRTYGNALWLPDGTVLLVNGYVSEPGSVNDVVNPLGTPDGVRRPQIVDPFARTVVTLEPWPEPTGRGYHSFALLLKDGRVLIGGGKDGNHNTGCEKNELRIYSPPYLAAGPRPVITNVSNGKALTVGGQPLTITYTGTVRATRGVAMVAPGSVTHAFDQGQRYVPLATTTAPANGTVTVAMPKTLNEAPPGDYVLYLISDLGVPSQGVHVRLGAPPPCVYTVSGAADTYLEAETPSRITPVFKQMTDATRSGGAFVQVDPATTSTTSVPDESRVMWFDLNVTTAGTYYVWLLANGPDGSQDSFFVSLDGNPDLLFNGLPANTWGWARNATALNVSAGKHILKVKVRERGTKLDKIRLTSSASTAAPAGLGGSATPCVGPPPPPASITNLVVNDTALGSDGVPNNTQWSVQSNFAGGVVAFADRTYTVGPIPAAAAHLMGKPWIRATADSKFYTASSPPVATATMTGSFVYIAVDSRHATTFLSSAGYTQQAYTLTLNEGATVRTYNVWRRAITSGNTVTLPSLRTTNGTFYITVVQ